VADPVPTAEPERIRSLPRPLTPLWSRKWRGFPAAIGPLIGRKRECAALSVLLTDQQHRLITVIGPGGVGKTRLALEAAENAEEAFPDGAAYIPLAAIDDPTLILPTIAQIFGVHPSPDHPLVDALAASLHGRRVLLVLDNFEHLVSASAIADIAALLRGSPQITILATSRAPLQLHNEQRFTTPPLALPGKEDDRSPRSLTDFGAVALFLSCARAVNRDFALDTTNAHIIAEICRRLDGLPLAIELAAPWLRVLSPSALLDRLERRLPLLTGGGRDQPPRLRSLKDTIDWSHTLLSADEQRLFRRLAMFSGGFSLEAAEAVGGDGFASVLDLLAALIDKSLVQQVDPTGPTPRFAMLETVREYALERLVESWDSADVAAAYTAYYVALAERIEPKMLGPNEQYLQLLLDAEIGNIRAALAWALEHDAEAALRIAAPLWVYWSVYLHAEGRRWLGAALACTSPVEDSLRAEALATDAALACMMGDFASSDESAAIAAALAEAAGDPLGEARARWIAGASFISSGRSSAAVNELIRSLRLFATATTSADRARKAYVRASLGAATMMLGDSERGLLIYEQALTEVRSSQSAGVSIVILCDFAGWLVVLGETSRARRLLEEALLLAAGHSRLLLAVTIMIGLASVDAVEGAAVSAALCLGTIEALRIQSGLVLPTHYQERVDRAASLAKNVLGEDTFAAVWATGRADPHAVIAAALDSSMAAGIDPRQSSVATKLGLSPREREVLDLLIDGKTDREIAAALYISPRTASSHVSAILHKLGAGSRAEAAVLAVRFKLTSDLMPSRSASRVLTNGDGSCRSSLPQPRPGERADHGRDCISDAKHEDMRRRP
jgi:predicted ATPase/DNA-binding CsgD family transcriptional regulator